ncbi:MAG TPA: pyrroloquinoline quinone biosynthesis peptide chaperone PqqD [Thermoanaerobaculia bacterium]|nr:pyrroloquinoline quinone biosynthesis peptide chaperone PqqD [Thermoanaerobaculia bacterium]
MDPRTRLERNERVLTQQVAGTRVLLDPDSGRYYALDEISGRVWDLCDGSRDIGDIVTTLQDEYEAEPETVEHDVRRFLADMLAERLLAVAAAPGE